MKRTTIFAAAFALTLTAIRAADAPHWIETLGGHIVRGPDGAIVEASVARTWATDADIARIAEIKTLKKLDLSHTYASDRSIEKLPQLQQLEELILDTCEFITDASLNYLRANKNLKRLVLRGTDVTDVGMPHLAQLTGLKRLDISHSMLGDVGLESL